MPGLLGSPTDWRTDAARIGPQPHRWIDVDGAVVTVLSTGIADQGDGLSIIRAIAHELWRFGRDGEAASIRSGDDDACRALAAVHVIDVRRRGHTAV